MLKIINIVFFVVLFLHVISLPIHVMTSQEWKAYKQSDAYKKEREAIEARKVRSQNFLKQSKTASVKPKKVFKYSYNVKEPLIASQRYLFNINGVDASIPYESNHALKDRNVKVKKLIIAIHSSNHDAKMYYNNTLSLLKALKKEDQTLIVAPHLLISSLVKKADNADFLFWENPPFRGSSRAFYLRNKVNISAYEILDNMINTITRSGYFPHLKNVVIFGHSAGGQFVNRYAAYSRFNKHGLHVRYIVMAPSSYIYFTSERAIKGSRNRFAVPNVDSKVYNRWGFGMEKLYKVHRRHKVTPEMMKKQYKNSEVIYLVGSHDNNPNDASLGKSKGSMWQGRHRVERAEIYVNYLQYLFGKNIKHRLHVIPNIGHSSKGLMHSRWGKEHIFNH